MNKVQLRITFGLLYLLLLINQFAGVGDGCARCPGGLPWYGWASGFVSLFIAGLFFARWRGERAHQLLTATAPAATEKPAPDEKWNEDLRRKYDWDGPAYPHPVIVTERCIGCSACVESCPHDVLTISYTEKHQPVASVVDHELCMDDTSCEAACPVSPKACIVVNTPTKIRSLPAPWRNSRYMSSVQGCYIIGDVSGTPLIKNAANEGAAVMVHVAHELHDHELHDGGDSQASQPLVDYDVAIIGAGPAGLSAAIMAKKLKLSCICIEQETVMSTIARYPKGKYVFLKPETMTWAGAINLPGLEEYMEEVLEEMMDEPERARAAEMLAEERAAARRLEEKMEAAKRDGKSYEPGPEDELDPRLVATLAAARERYRQLIEAEFMGTLDEEARQRLKRARARFGSLLEGEDMSLLGQLLAEECAGRIMDEELTKKERLRLARWHHGAQLEATVEAGKLKDERFATLAAARCKVAGDQREVLLHTWLLNMIEHNVRVNEKESCEALRRAEDGDYFVVETRQEKGKGKTQPMTYSARRVVLAIGNSSSPLKLIDKDSDRILYRLTDPTAYTNLDLIVVGGGNSAVEAAVDLVASRQGDEITLRTGKQLNRVKLLVRGPGLKTDVKFRNKQQLYQCIDHGLIQLFFEKQVKDVDEKRVVATNLVTGEDDFVERYDFIFALIGSARPAALLEQIKVKIVQ
jgi:thioredoxin reductase/NAD-dependent dihydropyrimidine dehydrogenase PreA subunit